ncbi:Integrase/recombinase xerD [Favolaschia claudopus]|uniref:Integrase/recombinase xerD n=1 Tax=Favolaschia claudopus TaxID=2862362 RepID=A0AAV9ZMG7_9AGAR
MNMTRHKTYKSLHTLLPPLLAFFSILGYNLPACSPIPIYFQRYIAHLALLATEYEWAAVFEYHTYFFNRRRNEMLLGNYNNWGEPEAALMTTYVYQHRKQPVVPAKAAKKVTPSPSSSSTSDPCRNFNAGKCETPCAWKRQHICAVPNCGKEHPATQHK